MSKISVIVPVYNIEKYLVPCVEALIAQDYKELEIILINDGSKDSSGAIIDSFAKKDSRIVPVHKKNGGVSTARNKGLEIATGEWIMFLDGDDYLETNTCSCLMDLTRQYDVDAIMFEYQAEWTNGKVQRHRFVDGRHYGLLSNEQAMYCVYNGAWFCCCKLYKKSILNNLKFKEDIHRGEDSIFAIEAIKNTKSVLSIPEIFYHYVQSDGSAARGGITARQLTGIDAWKWMLDFADKNYPELHDRAVIRYINIMVEFYLQMFREGYRDRKVIQHILSETQRYMKEALLSTEISKHQKIKFLLFQISPQLFCILLSMRRHL